MPRLEVGHELGLAGPAAAADGALDPFVAVLADVATLAPGDEALADRLPC